MLSINTKNARECAPPTLFAVRMRGERYRRRGDMLEKILAKTYDKNEHTTSRKRSFANQYVLNYFHRENTENAGKTVLCTRPESAGFNLTQRNYNQACTLPNAPPWSEGDRGVDLCPPPQLHHRVLTFVLVVITFRSSARYHLRGQECVQCIRRDPNPHPNPTYLCRLVAPPGDRQYL